MHSYSKKIYGYLRKSYRLARSNYIKLENRIKYYCAIMIFLISSSHDKTVILMGEKDANEARDNSFTLFKHLISSGRTNVYYVIRRNSQDLGNLDVYKDHIIFYNSLKHFVFIFRSKVMILNDGFIDVYPSYAGILRKTNEPFIYLQHGIFRYKIVFFNPGHYYGRILRLIASLESEREILVNRMTNSSNFEQMRLLDVQRQLMGGTQSTMSKDGLRTFAQDIKILRENNHLTGYANAVLGRQIDQINTLLRHTGFPEARIPVLGLPRHDHLPVRQPRKPKKNPKIYVFFTWRDYWPKRVSASNVKNSAFYNLVKDMISSPEFRALIDKWDAHVEISLHQKLSDYLGPLQSIANDRISFKRGADDMKRAFSESDIFVTDYSSIALDFCLAGVPVVFYHPDRDAYERSRGSYIENDTGWVGPIAENINELVYELSNTISGKYTEQSARHQSELMREYPNFGGSTIAIKEEVDNLPPRITFVCYNIYGIGGTVSSVTNLANYLYSQGYLVDIFSLRRTSKTPELGLHPAIRVTSFLDFTNGGVKGLTRRERVLSKCRSVLTNRAEDHYGGSNLLIDIRLALAVRKCTSDVIVCTFPSLAKIALKFRRKKTKVVVQEHKFFSSHSPEMQKFIAKTYPKADGVLALTQADAEEYATVTGKGVFVIPNGVPASEPSLNMENSEVKRIVALGRLDKQKQFHLLIEAFALIHKDFPEWRVFLYGQGAEMKNLSELIKNKGLNRKVFLKGSVKGASKVVASADICAVSSSYEGFGMVFIEAYAAGKPVVTFDIERGPKEIVGDGITGMKALPFDVTDYAQKLRMLMESEKLRHQLGENGRDFFLKRFDINVIGAKFESTIKTILAS